MESAQKNNIARQLVPIFDGWTTMVCRTGKILGCKNKSQTSAHGTMFKNMKKTTKTPQWAAMPLARREKKKTLRSCNMKKLLLQGSQNTTHEV